MKATPSKAFEARQQLIQLIQDDYSHIRKELLNLSSRLHEKEIMVTKLVGAALTDLEQTGGNHNTKLAGNSSAVDGVRSREVSSAIPPVAGELCVPTLEARCLGRFRIFVDSKEIVHWRSLKAKSLLKYLVGNNNGHLASRDILMEALWPGCDASTANNNLKVAVLALRKTLESNHGQNGASQVVVFSDRNYGINSKVALYIDAEQFEHHWQAGKHLERQGKDEDAIAEYDAAVTLYEGDFLEDDIYEDWTLIRRETLKDKYLAILAKLADYSMQKADYDGAIVYCEKVLGKDCCREDVYHRLMTCYSRMGQRNRAIDWYRLCEKTIRRELEVGPDQELVALYDKLARGECI